MPYWHIHNINMPDRSRMIGVDAEAPAHHIHTATGVKQPKESKAVRQLTKSPFFLSSVGWL